MYCGYTVAVVIPIYNEANFIVATLEAIPNLVDQIIVVDDGSKDHALTTLTSLTDPRLYIIRHTSNQGVGAATISGYRQALGLGVDLIAVIDGDGQMDSQELPNLLDSLILNRLDYVKGQRFLHPSIQTMPWLRYLGNRLFSCLMQAALGWHCSLDSQCGYTVITSIALRQLDLTALYPRYGFLNTLLFQLAAHHMQVGSVPVKTIYGAEVSNINPFVTIPVILSIIGQGYWQRIIYGTKANQLAIDYEPPPR